MSVLLDRATQLVAGVRTRELVSKNALTEESFERVLAWSRLGELLTDVHERIRRADRILEALEEWEVARAAHAERRDTAARKLLEAIDSYGVLVDPRALDPSRPAQLELGDPPPGDRGNPPP